MATFGNRPEDAVTDSRGNVQPDVVITVYGSESDATSQRSSLGSQSSGADGRWPIEVAGRTIVWAREPKGSVWPVGSDDVLPDHETRIAAVETELPNKLEAADISGKADVSYVDTGLAAKLDSATAASTYGTKAQQDTNTTDIAARATVTDVKARARLVIPAGAGTADTTALQAAIDDAATNGAPLDVRGIFQTNSPLAITAPVRVGGHLTFNTRIVTLGCNAIEVAEGVSDFHLENIELASSTRYTTTANTLVGIKVAGSTSSRPSNHDYRKVYVDGFQTAFQSEYLWASAFETFRCNYGLIGLDAYGLSVNNFVGGGSQIVVAIVAGSKAVRLAGQESPTDATDVGSEGWTIGDSLLYGGEYGVDIIGNAHINIHDCIIDFCQQYGVRIRDNGTNFGGNVRVAGNYIAMTGASGVAAVQSANTISHAQNTKNRIHDNHLTVYSGSTCSYGINQSGSNGLVNARGNTIKGFATADVYLQSSGNTIVENECLSGMANAIVGTNGQTQLIANNTGAVYLPGGGTSPWAYEMVGGRKVASGIAAPTVNTWAVGDRVLNALPAVGSPKAWVCTVAGTPGTWVSEGNL